MGVGGRNQLAVIHPLEIEREHSHAGLFDAPLLFVLDALARRADVAVDIENRRHFAAQVFGLIQDRGGPEAGDNLIAQLAHPVPLAGSGWDQAEIFEPRRGGSPIGGPTVKNDFVEEPRTQACGLSSPVRRIGGGGTRRSFRDQVVADLAGDDVGRGERGKMRGDTAGIGLGEERERENGEQPDVAHAIGDVITDRPPFELPSGKPSRYRQGWTPYRFCNIITSRSPSPRWFRYRAG